MNVTPTQIPGVLILEPKVFADDRGFFFESFNQRVFEAAVGGPVTFVQDNHSRSKKNVLRGLHHQVEQPQGKLVRVLSGSMTTATFFDGSVACLAELFVEVM
jgi:dTDP-4-dehydrorhamnose 3,5-epimerase